MLKKLKELLGFSQTSKVSEEPLPKNSTPETKEDLPDEPVPEGKEAEIYTVVSVDKSQVTDHPNLVDDLMEEKVDGMIIRSFVDPALTERIMHNVNTQEEYRPVLPFGSTIGHPIFSFPHGDVEANFKQNDGATEVIDEVLTFDFEQQFFSCLQDMSERYQFSKLYKEDHSFLLGTVRCYPPNKGGLVSHTGNEYIEMHKEKSLVYHHQQLSMMDSFSYFMLLQEPDEGGHLTLFDLLYKDTPKEFKGFYSNPETHAKAMKRYDYQHLKMKAGDLLLFRGGNIWHRVDPVTGSKDRVTFGGFFAQSKTSNTVHFWS